MINLDPAAIDKDIDSRLYDIRLHINYKDIMKKYMLGPNGTIMTALNICAAQEFPKEVFERRKEYDFCIIDTPGQIEAFTWSASGEILFSKLQALCNNNLTLVFVIDSMKCSRPDILMSSLLYACSVCYRFNAPMIILLNKSDLLEGDHIIKLIKDPLYLQEQCQYIQDTNYSLPLIQTMSFVLEELYKSIPFFKISAFQDETLANFITNYYANRCVNI